MTFFQPRRDAPALALIAAMLLGSLLVWPIAPDTLPVHFDATGTPDRYGGRFEGLLLLPIVAFGVWALVGATASLDPGRANIGRSGIPFAITRTGVVGFLALLHAVILAGVLGFEVNVSSVAFAGVGLLFVALGGFMGKIRPNYSFGIRTPWTLASKEAWLRTHRAGGWFMLITGLAILASAAISPVGAAVTVLVGALANVLFVMAYSYVVWKQDPDKTPPVSTLPAD